MEFLNFLAQYRSPAGDVFFQGITYLAQEIFVVAVICWLFWCANKKLAYTLGLAYFTSGLLIQGLKITFRIPRPWVLDPNFEAVPSALPDATGYSFPSGHTQSITALFGTLGLYTKRMLSRFLCFFLIFAVMFSRMYLGCHTLKDVSVSFALTLICVLLNYTAFYKTDRTSGREALLALLMLLLCAALSIYAILLNRGGLIDIAYAQDCLKASGGGAAFALGFYVEKKYISFSMPSSGRQKLVRFLAGLLVTLCIQMGLKPVLGTSLAACFVRYFLVVAWIVMLYPALFCKKLFTRS